jgi:hypothetical protein
MFQFVNSYILFMWIGSEIIPCYREFGRRVKDRYLKSHSSCEELGFPAISVTACDIRQHSFLFVFHKKYWIIRTRAWKCWTRRALLLYQYWLFVILEHTHSYSQIKTKRFESLRHFLVVKINFNLFPQDFHITYDNRTQVVYSLFRWHSVEHKFNYTEWKNIRAFSMLWTSKSNTVCRHFL